MIKRYAKKIHEIIDGMEIDNQSSLPIKKVKENIFEHLIDQTTKQTAASVRAANIVCQKLTASNQPY